MGSSSATKATAQFFARSSLVPQRQAYFHHIFTSCFSHTDHFCGTTPSQEPNHSLRLPRTFGPRSLPLTRPYRPCLHLKKNFASAYWASPPPSPSTSPFSPPGPLPMASLQVSTTTAQKISYFWPDSAEKRLLERRKCSCLNYFTARYPPCHLMCPLDSDQAECLREQRNGSENRSSTLKA